MSARVDQRIVDDEVAALRQSREKRVVRGKAAAKIKRRLRAEERRRVRLQAFVLGVVAAQEPRPARAHGDAAIERLPHRLLHLRRIGEREIIV